MDLAYLLGSNQTPLNKRYQVDQDFSTAGVPVLVSATGESGVDLATTTGFVDALGVSMDTALKKTAQQTDGTTAARLLMVTISPDAVYRARLSGDNAAGTALTIGTITTASADGLSVITSAFDPNSPDLADGVVWGLKGANVGDVNGRASYRKITATASNDATVEIPFDVNIAVGDQFLYANRFEGDVSGITLVAELTEVDAMAAEATTGAMRVVDMILNDHISDGTLSSYFNLILADHAYRGVT